MPVSREHHLLEHYEVVDREDLVNNCLVNLCAGDCAGRQENVLGDSKTVHEIGQLALHQLLELLQSIKEKIGYRVDHCVL